MFLTRGFSVVTATAPRHRRALLEIQEIRISPLALPRKRVSGCGQNISLRPNLLSFRNVKRIKVLRRRAARLPWLFAQGPRTAVSSTQRAHR